VAAPAKSAKSISSSIRVGSWSGAVNDG